jgi:ribosome maturation factor RimP
MIDIQHIRKLTEEKIQGSNIFLVDLQVKTGNRIFVSLDGDHGVTIEDCASVSHHIESALAEGEDHELVVSSFGADQPLRLPRQYAQHIGRSLTVKLNDEAVITGELTAVTNDGIAIKPEQKKKKKKDEQDLPETMSLAFSSISTAKVNISFNKK